MTAPRTSSGRDDETTVQSGSSAGKRPAVVVCSGVGHYYGKGELRSQALTGIDLTIQAGESVLLTGPSGSGKSTLLRLIAGLLPVQEGQLQVLGCQANGLNPRQRRELRRRIGFLFPHPELIEALTVAQNVELALGGLGLSARERQARIREILTVVGLEKQGRYPPRYLSGGQAKRAAIARALVHSPDLLIASEPTSNMDSVSAAQVAERLRDLAHNQGTAILLLSRDLRDQHLAERVIRLDAGRVSSDTRRSGD